MGSNFGDFLMELDDLTDMVEGKCRRDKVFAKSISSRDDDDSDDSRDLPEEVRVVGHMIDDDEQEDSDLDDEDSEDEEGGDEVDEDEDEDEGTEDDELNDDEEGGNEGDEEEGDDQEEEEDKGASSRVLANSKHEYRPSEGEDIYGRRTDVPSNATIATKYVPPARRAQLAMTIDEVGADYFSI